jgi:hypothetical protein
VDRNGSPVTVGLIGSRSHATVAAAASRARDLGVRFEIVEGDPFEVIARSDLVLALTWPSGGESLAPALAAMAAGKPVVVYEVEATAGWPALDPQTWRPRGPSPTGLPVVVSIDVRDEAHSLLLVLRRLGADAALRDQLGAAAHSWWREHGTIEGAAREWERLIAAAAAGAPAVASAPAADGTRQARDLLAPFGISVEALFPTRTPARS